jgi:hypothetical protein
MEIDVDTFLVTVYCEVDDVYQEQFAAQKPPRPGHQPEMSDSEVLTLAILTQWREHSTERGMLAYARQHWRQAFPVLLSQSAFNRRVRDLASVLCALGPALAQRLASTLGPAPVYQVMDGVPIPLMQRCRGERHRLFGQEAAVGRGGSDRSWYYGLRLLDVIDNRGVITGFVLGPATTEERWLAEALLCWRSDPTAPAPTAEDLDGVLSTSHMRGGRVGPTGPIRSRYGAGRPSRLPIISDRGFRGSSWERHWREDYGAQVITEEVYEALEDPTERQRAAAWLHRHRQRIETIHDLLDDVLHLARPGAHTLAGLLARIGAKVAALNLLISFNHAIEHPAFSHFTPFD